jgi:hypothetical protein
MWWAMVTARKARRLITKGSFSLSLLFVFPFSFPSVLVFRFGRGAMNDELSVGAKELR